MIPSNLININYIKFIGLTFLVLFFVFLSGCGTLKDWNKVRYEQPEYKYVPAVSNEVSFVVIPFNNYSNQLEFSAKVESVLLENGLSLVAAPRGITLIEERTGAGFAQDSGASNLSSTSIQREESQALRIEKYQTMEETKADYIVETMLKGDRGTVKVTRKKDSKIMSVFSVYSSNYSLNQEMLRQLEKMQFIMKVKVDNLQNQE